MLNDYDCSCMSTQDVPFAGTPATQLRRFQFYRPVDDLLSLCLSFASLVLPEWKDTVEEKMHTLVQMSKKEACFQSVSSTVADVAKMALEM